MPSIPPRNFFDISPSAGTEEIFEILLERPGLCLERIVSYGQASPPGHWYDQDGDEWVLLVRGQAILEYADGEPAALKAGDFQTIPAHCRHRVAEVSPDAVWLALHFDAHRE